MLCSPDFGARPLLSLPALGDPGVGGLAESTPMGVNTRSCAAIASSSLHTEASLEFACDRLGTVDAAVTAAAAANSSCVSSSSSLPWSALGKVFALLVGNALPELFIEPEDTGELEARALTVGGARSRLDVAPELCLSLLRLDIRVSVKSGIFASWLEKEVEEDDDDAAAANVVAVVMIAIVVDAFVVVVVAPRSSVVRMRLFGLSVEALMSLLSEGHACKDSLPTVAGLEKMLDGAFALDGELIMDGARLRSWNEGELGSWRSAAPCTSDDDRPARAWWVG